MTKDVKGYKSTTRRRETWGGPEQKSLNPVEPGSNVEALQKGKNTVLLGFYDSFIT